MSRSKLGRHIGYSTHEIKVDEDAWIETCKRFARSFCWHGTVGDLANGEISLEQAQENMRILQTVANIRAEMAGRRGDRRTARRCS